MKSNLVHRNISVIKIWDSKYGGNYDYSFSNGDGDPFNENYGYTLDDIYVTPDGNYWDDDTNWLHELFPDNPMYDDDFFGRDNSLTTPEDYAQCMADGNAVLNAMIDSIKNGTALYVEKVSDSAAYKIANLSNYASDFVMPVVDVMEHLYVNSPETILKLGKSFGRFNAVTGSVLAIITVYDENTDWWAIASAAAGVFGLLVPASWPLAVPLVIDGLAITFGAISLANSSSENNSRSSNY